MGEKRREINKEKRVGKRRKAEREGWETKGGERVEKRKRGKGKRRIRHVQREKGERGQERSKKEARVRERGGGKQPLL